MEAEGSCLSPGCEDEPTLESGEDTGCDGADVDREAHGFEKREEGRSWVEKGGEMGIAV
ncbi:hypothetical protein HPP92_023602 [Vanilla planifolia]|uniref:Uncharacterized protein n=1 Tax=Vanilla planifolia TaxID=51239 RepID=A0A835PLX7_VANPL|nr:hypothetical protein HPP92_023913 [Vanilla planifolia]KAG0455814.1 hypothetical protein HPP92_023602 [Vanilla planifolia]